MAAFLTSDVNQDSTLHMKDLLYELYWIQQLSTPAIGERLGVSTSAVRKWMMKFGIPRREGTSVQLVIGATNRRTRPQASNQKGAANHNWKGGRTLHTKGYVLAYAPDHPNAVGSYVLEHRLVAEQMLGRPLGPDEDVHHKDGDKTNNQPENLEVLTHDEHARLHRLSSRLPVPLHHGTDEMSC